MSSIKRHIIQTFYLYTEKVKENFLMKYKKRENIKAERKRKRIEIRGFLLKKLSDFVHFFKEPLDNEITAKSITPGEKEKIEFVIEMSSFEIECV